MDDVIEFMRSVRSDTTAALWIGGFGLAFGLIALVFAIGAYFV